MLSENACFECLQRYSIEELQEKIAHVKDDMCKTESDLKQARELFRPRFRVLWKLSVEEQTVERQKLLEDWHTEISLLLGTRFQLLKLSAQLYYALIQKRADEERWGAENGFQKRFRS